MSASSSDGLHIGLVGATGQVGGVMRAILAERKFPVASMRSSRPRARPGGRWIGTVQEIVVEDAELANHIWSRHCTFLGRRRYVEGIGAEVRGGRG